MSNSCRTAGVTCLFLAIGQTRLRTGVLGVILWRRFPNFPSKIALIWVDTNIVCSVEHMYSRSVCTIVTRWKESPAMAFTRDCRCLDSLVGTREYRCTDSWLSVKWGVAGCRCTTSQAKSFSTRDCSRTTARNGEYVSKVSKCIERSKQHSVH
jgi:hypothetical protein